MQRILEKMAQKLNEYDEASLMQLWQQFAGRVHEFEPSKRWEEAAIALCLIQAVHWKNQLFNYHLALSAGPPDRDNLPPLPNFFGKSKGADSRNAEAPAHKAKVLSFPERHAARPQDVNDPSHDGD
ncbi:MAG: hypothetical protein LBH65_06390 [Desulfovibrio sp.]|jgi:hypothetical protein|nr:hypothetical protein [Desulfovibrio sp.]